jgi:hypothetical protein
MAQKEVFMSDDFALFSTKEEATAFVLGYRAAIDLIDDCETTVTEPVPTVAGDWRVDYGYHVRGY